MVIVFTRFYYKNHPRYKEETMFIPKLWKAYQELGYKIADYSVPLLDKYSDYYKDNFEDIKPKYITIRRSGRWKPGDQYDPRVWSFIPRHSKQIMLTWKPIKIVKTSTILIEDDKVFVDGKRIEDVDKLAHDDGLLDAEDFLMWHGQERYYGQISYWKEREYD